jgi:cytochrome P450
MTLAQTTMKQRKVPPGPSGDYSPEEDLFLWMNRNFERYGDIYKALVYGSNVYVVSAPQYCERVLRRNWQNYARKGLVVQRIKLALGHNLITSNGELWARQRRMIQPAFTKNAIGSLIDMIADVNVEVLEKWKAAARNRKTVNVTKDLSLMVLKITLTFIFGDDYETVAPHFSLFAEESARDFRFAQELDALGKLVLQIVTQRRRENRTATDSLGTMMDARDRDRGQPMSDAQLVREVLTLVVAGHETTASLLNWLWYLLATHPEAQLRLANELDRLPWKGSSPTMDSLSNFTYTRQVIDEALRLYPPLWLMSRKAINEDHLGEYFVPSGTEIFISPYLIQRSPQLWETPDRFEPDRLSLENGPDRDELAMCPFGAGPRKCIGDLLARIEIQTHLMMFGRELRLRYDEKKAPEFAIGLNLLSRHDFHMLPEARTPSGAHAAGFAGQGETMPEQ